MQQSGEKSSAAILWRFLRKEYKGFCSFCAVNRRGKGKFKGENSRFKGHHIKTNWKKYRDNQYR